MPGNSVPTELAELRAAIDDIDAQIIDLLGQRFDRTRAVGEYKASHDLPSRDDQREQRQSEQIRKLAEDNSLDPGFVDRLMQQIRDEVVREHAAIKAERQH